MRIDLVKKLIKAHAEGDEAGFRKLALQLAADESHHGHVRVAEELRSIISTMGAGRPLAAQTGQIVDISRPRGELAGLLDGGYRRERLKDIVLPPEKRAVLERLIQEIRSRSQLEAHGVNPRRRMLFHGPPGCGKTLAAAVVAGELGLPLMTVRFDALFSKFLGATANHLRLVFDEMPRHAGVYFFDEFDAVGKSRADTQDVGEMRRVVTSFLQLVDADPSPSPLIAATNHPDLLDHAVFRRFDVHVAFELPNNHQLLDLISLRLGAFKLDKTALMSAVGTAAGLSYADAAHACDDAIRTMVIEGRDRLDTHDVDRSFQHIQNDRVGPIKR